jgi:hypothetical protein
MKRISPIPDFARIYIYPISTQKFTYLSAQNTAKSHPLHSPPPTTCMRRKDIETGTKNNWDDDGMLVCMPKLKHSDLATLHHKYLSSKPTDLTKRELADVTLQRNPIAI